MLVTYYLINKKYFIAMQLKKRLIMCSFFEFSMTKFVPDKIEIRHATHYLCCIPTTGTLVMSDFLCCVKLPVIILKCRSYLEILKGDIRRG